LIEIKYSRWSEGEDTGSMPEETMDGIFRSPAARQDYREAYSRLLRHWPKPRLRRIGTLLGSTNVIESGDAGWPPIVLLPAVGVSAASWFPIASMLFRHHHIYAVDVVGDAGLSELVRSPKSPVEYANWLAEVVDGLGLQRPAVVGHSYGGWLALLLGRYRPDAAGPLVLLAPAAGLSPFHWHIGLFLGMAERLPVKPGAGDTLRMQAHKGFQLEPDFVALMEVVNREVRTNVLFPAPMSDDDLAAIECPTLILIGEDEVLFDPGAALARGLELMPHAEGRLVPETSHLLPMERPALVDEAIEAFLERCEGRFEADQSHGGPARGFVVHPREVAVSEDNKSGWETFTEEIEVAGTEVVEEINRLLAEGNVRRLKIRSERGDVFLSVPLTAGAVAGGVVVIAAPWLAVIAAIAGIASRLKLEITRDPPEPGKGGSA
jgi:pimeloyl-ACP methyl ester carboxylesterase